MVLKMSAFPSFLRNSLTCQAVQFRAPICTIVTAAFYLNSMAQRGATCQISSDPSEAERTCAVTLSTFPLKQSLAHLMDRHPPRCERMTAFWVSLFKCALHQFTQNMHIRRLMNDECNQINPFMTHLYTRSHISKHWQMIQLNTLSQPVSSINTFFKT